MGPQGAGYQLTVGQATHAQATRMAGQFLANVTGATASDIARWVAALSDGDRDTPAGNATSWTTLLPGDLPLRLNAFFGAATNATVQVGFPGGRSVQRGDWGFGVHVAQAEWQGDGQPWDAQVVHLTVDAGDRAAAVVPTSPRNETAARAATKAALQEAGMPVAGLDAAAFLPRFHLDPPPGCEPTGPFLPAG